MDSLVILTDAAIYNSGGLLWVVLGTYVLIRASGYPDLTIDGSFTIGAALFTACLLAGYGTGVAVLAAMLGGAIAGLSTWTVNQWLGVGQIASSIIVMIIFVLAAPYLVGSSSRGILDTQSWFGDLERIDAQLTAALFAGHSYRLHLVSSLALIVVFIAVAVAVVFWLGGRTGVRLRYLGSASNPHLLSAREQRLLRAVGLAVGNALVAIGGAVEAQHRGGFAANMGTGMVLVGITTLILGESVLKVVLRREYLHVSEELLAVFVGTGLYCLGIQALLSMGLGVVDVRLLTALFLLMLLGVAGRYFPSSTKLF
jgi:putative ABC transport system permease protein